MASGEDKDKDKDHFDPEDSDKQNDKKDEATSSNYATGKKSKNDENPFSFKKFLQASDGQNGSKSGCMKVVNHDLAKDLPDFVQGHTSHAESSRSQNNLPDFTFCTSRKKPTNDIASIQSSHLPPTPPIQQASIDDPQNLSLPDFLSGSLGVALLKDDSIDEHEHNLQLQNSILWQKIEQLNAAFLAEKQKNDSLSSQLGDTARNQQASTSNSSPQASVHSHESQIKATGEERPCGRCLQMAEHVRNASEQLNSIVQAANHFSRVLAEGSQNLSHLSQMLSSDASSSSPPSDQHTVQEDH